MAKKLTKEEFVERSIKAHGNKYDYSLVDYKNSSTKVEIICPTHGVFWQVASTHLKNHGCPLCAGNTPSNSNIFIEKAKKVHGNKYNYSKVVYTNNHTKVEIVCPLHGIFEKTPDKHVNSHQGCPKCSGKFLNKDFFIEKAKRIHSNKYDYSLVEYRSNNRKVKIICSTHGVFTQTPNNHLSGATCPFCAGKIMNQSFFVEKANIIHNNFYEYSLTYYSRSNIKVKIICPIHGVFEQTPNMHLIGQGCPKCCSSKGELAIEAFLMDKKLMFSSQFRIKECRNKLPLPFDFAVFEDKEKTKLKCLIEFDGEQHYKICKNFKMNNKNLSEIQRRDKIKTDYCLQNNIKLIRIPYWEKNNIEKILSKELTIK